ncbi:MAG: heparinase II/III family protein, partial [Oscillospiraceae bacterium]|nr:heparinase II/III family protein [Oscillospiraceae bacterium]
MTGFGFAVLRDGLKTKNATSTTAQNTLRDIWMYFGRTSGHGHLQMLNLGMDAYGLNVAPDTGYPELTGYQPNRWQWVRTTISHNTITVNEKQQNQMTAAATPLHFEDAGKVKVMDIEAPGAYTETSEYRRCAVMVEVNDDVAYTVDFFRIKGGEQHTYSFHSQAENAYPADESINLTYQTEDGTPNTPYVGSYADVNWPVGEDPVSPTNTANYWTKYPRGYSWMDKVRYDKNLKTGKIAVEFDVRDYRKAITDSKGIKLRLTQLNDFVPDEVAIVGGYVPQSSRNTGLPKTLDYVLVHRKGTNLDTLFTTVLEPYKNTRYISEIDAVDITAIDGTEGVNDVARAVKVTHTDGRVDYIVYATNNAVTYNVADVFAFRGAVGVYSLNASGNVVYRYVTDGDIIGEATGSPANYSGTVAGYQRDLSFDNYIDVNMVCADIDSLAGKYIHIANDEIRNAVYRIDGANENEDGTIRLDIGTVSLIRGHNDVTDFDSGYVYDIQNNQKFTIPMSFADENLPTFDEVSSSLSTSAGSVITIGIKAKSPLEGMKLSYDALIFPRGAAINSETGVVTWKPDSSQVGDNHFAVTARDGDGRESTIHFIVTVYGSTTAGTENKTEEDEVADGSGISGETATPSGGGGGGGGGAAPADKPDDTTNTDETDEDESL